MDIRIIKVSSGEELIGEAAILETDAGVKYLELTNPCVIVFGDAGGRRVTMQFYPVALAAEERKIVISSESVVWTSVPSKEASDTYKQRYSKIITPEKSLVVPG